MPVPHTATRYADAPQRNGGASAAIAAPCTAATTGSRVRNSRTAAAYNSSVVYVAPEAPEKSAPAQKCLPRAASTTARACPAASSSSSASATPAIIANEKKLSGGRHNSTNAT